MLLWSVNSYLASFRSTPFRMTPFLAPAPEGPFVFTSPHSLPSLAFPLPWACGLPCSVLVEAAFAALQDYYSGPGTRTFRLVPFGKINIAKCQNLKQVKIDKKKFYTESSPCNFDKQHKRKGLKPEGIGPFVLTVMRACAVRARPGAMTAPARGCTRRR